MARTQVLTPPITPGGHDLHTKRNQRTQYKRIRFKNWQPEPPAPKESAHDNADTRQEPKASTPSSDSPTVQQSISEREFDEILRRAIASHPASPLSALPANGTRVDPFTELPIKTDGVVPATLDYFLSICAPMTKEGYTVHGHENPHMTLLFPFMMQSAMLFESVIALCRASILICVGKTPSEDRALTQHRTRAIKGVSESLSTSDATSDAVLLSVAMLLTLEYLVGNNAAVAAHRAGLHRMINMRTDLDNGTPWNTFVKAGLDAYKTLGSFVTGEPPDVTTDSHGYIHETFAGLCLDRPIDYPALPFPPELCTVLSRLPPGFSELCLSGRLSTQTMQVLASLSGTTTARDSAGYDQTRLDAEIQAMLSALQRLSLMKIASLEKYITCGLVAYAFQLRRLRALNLFHDPTLGSFIKLMPNQEKPDSAREQQCMIWISMAVSGSLSLRTIRMPGTHLVLDKTFELYPAMCNWITMEATVKSFFWTPSILKHWRKCHDVATVRWKQVTRVLQDRPLIDLTPASENSSDHDEIEEVDFEQLKAHTRGFPGDMMHMMGAAKCPFQSRIKMMDPNHTTVSPHALGSLLAMASDPVDAGNNDAS